MNLWILNSPGYIESHTVDEIGDTVAKENFKKLIETVANAAPLKRIGEPLDIAKGIVFLSSIDAHFITGANLVIDGGVMYNLP